MKKFENKHNSFLEYLEKTISIAVLQTIFIFIIENLSFKVWHNNSIIIFQRPSENSIKGNLIDVALLEEKRPIVSVWPTTVFLSCLLCNIWLAVHAMLLFFYKFVFVCQTPPLPAGKEIIKLSCLCWCKFQAADIHIYSGHWLILFKHQKRILQEENPSWCLTSISKELQKTIYTFNENFCCMKFLKLLYSTYFNPYLSSSVTLAENPNKIFKSQVLINLERWKIVVIQTVGQRNDLE